jgi:hypothetical protein
MANGFAGLGDSLGIQSPARRKRLVQIPASSPEQLLFSGWCTHHQQPDSGRSDSNCVRDAARQEGDSASIDVVSIRTDPHSDAALQDNEALIVIGMQVQRRGVRLGADLFYYRYKLLILGQDPVPCERHAY